MGNKLRAAALMLAVTLLFPFSFVACAEAESLQRQPRKLSVVATIFPQYDFARGIAGELADVTMLLPAGVESHSYEPSPADIIKIQNCDIFIYTGDMMELWAQKLLSTIDSGNIRVINLSDHVQLKKTGDYGHEHESSQDSGVEPMDDGAHIHDYDPHFWTDPLTAHDLVGVIADEMALADVSNGGLYLANAHEIQERLLDLHRNYLDMMDSSVRGEIIFGSRFAFIYLASRYGIGWVSAIDGCSTEAEPSAQRVAQLIDEIRNEAIPVIYYEDLIDPKIARSIAGQTDTEPVMLYSCHNVSKSQFTAGTTYFDLMNENLDALRKGLC